MSAAVALLIAIIGEEAEPREERVRDLLFEALCTEVDPVQHIIAQFGLSEVAAYERAARHCGLAFHASLRSEWITGVTLPNWDLGHVRTVRGQIFDRELLFTAPEFSQFLRLAQHVKRRRKNSGRVCVVPPRSLREALAQASAEELLVESRQRLARTWPRSTAHLEATRAMRAVFVFVLFGLAASAVLAPNTWQSGLTLLLGLLLMPPALIRLGAVWRSRFVGATSPPPPALDDAELPHYSVLVPLRDEAQMVHQLASALRHLDYPASKLDIKFIVESASPSTIEAVRQQLHSTQFELLVVPPHPPATKPKALNYALPLARGDLIVIYDAEDIPDPQQLRQAAAVFAQEPQTACVQAELRIDNGTDSLLTTLFAAEYAGLFGIMLPALAAWQTVLPLGGSSNHFRASVLREIGGWDAFNVTEDADLGARLARKGHQCATLQCPTLEEAPIGLRAWMQQRTRWMKGWMQTFLAHNRDVAGLWRDLGWRNFAFFEIYTAGLILSPMLHSLYAGALLWRFATGQPFLTATEGMLDEAAMCILGLGYASAIVVSLAGLAHTGQHRHMPALVLLPFYWLVMGWATFRAGIELVHRPHFWAKTTHGQSRRASSPRARAKPGTAPDEKASTDDASVTAIA